MSSSEVCCCLRAAEGCGGGSLGGQCSSDGSDKWPEKGLLRAALCRLAARLFRLLSEGPLQQVIGPGSLPCLLLFLMEKSPFQRGFWLTGTTDTLPVPRAAACPQSLLGARAEGGTHPLSRERSKPTGPPVPVAACLARPRGPSQRRHLERHLRSCGWTPSLVRPQWRPPGGSGP